MAATDARPVARKNQAFRIYFGLRQGNGNFVIGWSTPSGTISKDGGTPADTTNTPTEVTPNMGGGYLDLTATEMNCDGLLLKINTSNADVVPLLLTLYPESSGDYRCNVVEVNGNSVTSWATASALQTVDNNVDAILLDTGTTLDDKIDAIGIDIDVLVSGVNVTQVNGSAINLVSASGIADQVWDENLADHDTAGSAGHALVTASGNLITGNIPTNVWANSARTLTHLGPIAVSGDIAEAVWNALIADYGGAGTYGQYLEDTYTNADSTWTNVDAYLDATISSRSSHTAANVYTAFGTGSNLTAVGLSSTSINAVADQVWNEALSGHTTAGSAGRALALASGTLVGLTSTAQTSVAAQVWQYAERVLTSGVTLADTVHGGPFTQLLIGSGIIVNNTGGDAVLFQSTGNNGWGLACKGEGGGGGIYGLGGITGDGMHLSGAGTGGYGLLVYGDESAALFQAVSLDSTEGVIRIEDLNETAGGYGIAFFHSLGGYDFYGDIQGNLSGSVGSLVNLGSAAVSGDIAGAVWDAILSGHINAGSTGQALVTASGNLVSGDWATSTALQTVDDNVDAILVDTSTTLDDKIDTISLNVDVMVSGVNVTQVNGTNVNLVSASGIADQVWDESIADHLGAGSAGSALVTASGSYASASVNTSGLATTAQLEYWGLVILNNCGGGPVG